MASKQEAALQRRIENQRDVIGRSDERIAALRFGLAKIEATLAAYGSSDPERAIALSLAEIPELLDV